MKISLAKKTKIYVTTPAGVATGGAEAMHQLAYDLREMYEVDKVYMFYSPETTANPAPQAYDYFKLAFAREIEDHEDNVLIMTEGHTGRFTYLKHIRKAIWWISIDNYYLSYDYYANSRIKGRINKEILARGSQRFVFFNPELRKINWHLCQSEYAYQHLKRLGVEGVYYLRDHINQDFFQNMFDAAAKKNIVAYNPKKWMVFTNKVIAASPDITFVPIQNMTRAQVINLLGSAKVYMDFGNHPGKDKIPREAVTMGCCILTGRLGTSGFYEDIPIPSEYKFPNKRASIPLVREKIKECFSDYGKKSKDFDHYRAHVRAERDIALADIRNLFTAM